MFPYPNLLVMFAKQLLANHILVLSHDPNQSIHIFRMITHQFRQLLDLFFQLFQPQGHVP
jgi:hypothetical protein